MEARECLMIVKDLNKVAITEYGLIMGHHFLVPLAAALIFNQCTT
jgi:hypothetical protein